MTDEPTDISDTNEKVPDDISDEDDAFLLESLTNEEPLVLEGIAERVAETYKQNTKQSVTAAPSLPNVAADQEWREEFSNFRIKDRTVDKATLSLSMQNRVVVPLSSLSKEVVAKIKKEWVLIAVLGDNKGEKHSKRGDRYTSWEITDLRCPSMKTIPLHLYSFAIVKLVKENAVPGDIVLIMNPLIMESPENGYVGVSSSKAENIVILGKAIDFGRCDFKNTVSDFVCRGYCNSAKSRKCSLHLDEIFSEIKQGRTVFNLTAGPKVSMATQNQKSNKKQKLAICMMKQTPLGRTMAKMQLELQETEAKKNSKPKSHVVTKDGRVLDGLNNHLSKGVSVVGSRGLQQVFLAATGKNLQQTRAKKSAMEVKSMLCLDKKRKPNELLSVQPADKRIRTALQQNNKITKPKIVPFKAPIGSLRPAEYSDLVKQFKSLKPEQKFNLNSSKNSLLIPESRFPEAKPVKVPVELSQITRRKSRFEDAALAVQAQHVQGRLRVLATAEKQYEKLNAVQSVNVSGYFCVDCHKISEKKRGKCIEGNHTISVLPKIQKCFYKCKSCGIRVSTLGKEKYMKPCVKCKSIKFEPCSAYSDKSLGIPKSSNIDSSADLMINNRGPSSTFNSRSFS